ncbi:hypothetical protein MNB_SV-8-498 [hydrothermal vent metagenome]|uniref:Uncharacterized protein n=1 Tax=hydrothermal vent metagenome TaxID=652676 RepID=A0A1W1C5X2_9ZZZZ
MSKENILRITLFVSVLAFNPLVAETLKIPANIQTQQTNSIASGIANILHKRGIDEDAAEEISREFVAEDEALFARMMDNLLSGCKSINKEELLTYLSKEALFRNSVQLHDYDTLVAMVAAIREKALDKKTLSELQTVVKENRALMS